MRFEKMENQNFSTSILVNQTPEEVFNAINNVRGWWSENIEGDTDKAGAVFYYHYQDIHRCTFKITELVPGKKIVWHVLQNYFNFVEEKTDGRTQTLFLKLPRKVTKRRFALRMLDLCLNMNATRSVQTPGIPTLITVCST